MVYMIIQLRKQLEKLWRILKRLVWLQIFKGLCIIISLVPLKMGTWTTGGGWQLFEQNFLQTKVSFLGFWKSSRVLRGAITSRKSYCSVRFALWSEAVIRPYFCETDDETTLTVNSECYGHMITDFENSTVPHGFMARDISFPRNFSSWWHQLATKIM